jgi:hypothetical protein
MIKPSCDASAVKDYHISSQNDVEQVFFTPSAYNEAFGKNPSYDAILHNFFSSQWHAFHHG